MNKFYLSQTVLKAWEEDCPLAFSKRFFGTEAERKLFERDSDAMRRGVLFETLAIGSGLGGKVAKEGDVPRSSVYYQRIVDQAKLYREWENSFASKTLASQLHLKAEVKWDGGVYFSQGNLDRPIRDKNSVIMIVDLKLTGDKDNDYGKFQFGNLDKVDYTQLRHYRTLALINFKEPVRQMYYVADCSPKMGKKLIELSVSEWREYEHHERCQKAYNEIVSSLMLDSWAATPSADKCGSCPLKNTCKYSRNIPDIELYELT